MGRVVDPLVRDDGETEPELCLEAAVEMATSEADPEACAQCSSIVDEIDQPAAQSDQAPLDEPVGFGAATMLNGSTAQPKSHPPDVTAERAGTGHESPTATSGEADDQHSHPVRQRLLERAAAARRLPTTSDSALGVGEQSLSEAAPRWPMQLDLDLVASGRAPASPPQQRPRARLSPNLVALFGTLLGLAAIASLVALAIQVDPGSDPPPAPSSTAQADKPTAKPSAGARVRRRPRQRVPGPWRIADAKNTPELRTISGKVGRLPFLTAIQEAGVPKKQAYRVLTAMKGLRDFDKCQRTDRFVALLQRASSRVQAFEYIVSQEEVYQARESDNGLLVAKRLDLKVQREQVAGSIAVTTADLPAAIRAAGFEESLTSTLAKALDGHLSLEEIQQGDRLRIIAQEITVLGEFSRYAGIEALEYIPGRAAEKPLRIYYFRGPESRGYFDARGRSPYEGGWRKPIPGAPVTSPFDLKRLHPVLKKVMPHYGVDFGAPAGTPVGASSYGRVSYLGYAGAAGNLVKVEHPGKIETGYAHLSRFTEGLRVGDRVKRLQVVGYVGSTGRSTGPHLHFSAKRDGKFIDPMTLNLDAMRVLPKAERADFARVKEKYDRMLAALPLPAVPPPPPPTLASATAEATADDLGVGAGLDTREQAATEPETEAAQPAATAKPATVNPVYLTDKELLEMQPATDDGEVAE
jgi:murein DD-endopeptidase MepM/ murein hydrolase activator NlpD